MGKLYEEKWYQKWAKITNLGKFPRLYRYRYRAIPVHPSRSQTVPVQVQVCTGTPPSECKLYRYRSKVYRYRCAQNAQNVVFLYN